MQGGVARNVFANALTAGAMLATSLVSVPLIIDSVGIEGYGVWAIALTVILYVTVADAGVGPAVQRFVAVARGGDDEAGIARILWSALALYALAGGAAILAAYLAAPSLVDLFDVPGDLRSDAETTFRLVGPIALLGLLQASFGNVQQGLERFVAFAATTAVASVAYLAAVIAVLGSGGGLSELAYATLGQQALLIVLRGWTVRDVLASGRPRLVGPGERRALIGFAWRLQASVASTVVNTQTDKVVVGVVASPATVGQIGVAAQIAEAGRLVTGAALSPLTSRMAQEFGTGDSDRLRALSARLDRLWLLAVGGGTVIGVAALQPLIESWLGEGHGDAVFFGVFLVLAYGINMSTGAGAAYLRAVGRPGLEARYNLLMIGLNLVLTVALGLIAGAEGVVIATFATYALATAWFFTRLGSEADWLPAVGGVAAARALVLALLAGAAALAWGVLMVAVLPTGVGILGVGAGGAVAFVAYLSAATRVRPTPRNVRALFA